MHFQSIAVVLLVQLSSISCLECFNCDSSPISCKDPIISNCPPHAKCYTIFDTITRQSLEKGCAHSCDSIPTVGRTAHCMTCNHVDLCNDDSLINSGKGAPFDQHRIGGGVDVDNRKHGYDIGHGVSPNSCPSAFQIVSLLFAIAHLF